MKKTILLVMVLSGCVTEFRPAHANKPDNAFAAATRALVDDGETIEMKDEAAGVIVTKWEETTGADDDFHQRVRWKITIGSDVTVDSQCQNKDSHHITGHDWEDCGTHQPNGRSEKAANIARLISEAHAALQPGPAAAASPAAPPALPAPANPSEPATAP
jgi:hypothetical protein